MKWNFTNNEIRQIIAVMSFFVLTALIVPWGFGLTNRPWQEMLGACAPFAGYISWFFKKKEEPLIEVK